MLFRTASPGQISLALLVLRLVTGTVFIAHGAQKVFQYGFAGVAGAFEQMGIPMAGIMGPFVALVELLGGIALVIGLLTRLAALGLAIDMLVAVFAVHLSAGFFLPNGFEFAMLLFGASLALVIAGAGDYSADAAIARRRPRRTMG